MISQLDVLDKQLLCLLNQFLKIYRVRLNKTADILLTRLATRRPDVCIIRAYIYAFMQ
jgi:hypothetical protein